MPSLWRQRSLARRYRGKGLDLQHFTCVMPRSEDQEANKLTSLEASASHGVRRDKQKSEGKAARDDGTEKLFFRLNPIFSTSTCAFTNCYPELSPQPRIINGFNGLNDSSNVMFSSRTVLAYLLSYFVSGQLRTC
jgi:hypothetical protein